MILFQSKRLRYMMKFLLDPKKNQTNITIHLCTNMVDPSAALIEESVQRTQFNAALATKPVLHTTFF